MRLSYHKKIIEILPADFTPLIPQEPLFKFVVDDGMDFFDPIYLLK